MNKKNEKRKKEVYVYEKGKKTKSLTPQNYCKECKSHLGSSKISYTTKEVATNNIVVNNRHNVYKCPYGYGWHTTTDLRYERRKFLNEEFSEVKVILYKNDLLIELFLNEKNYIAKSLMENKSVSNFNLYTLWNFSSNISKKENLDSHKLLKQFSRQYCEIYEFEIIKKTNEVGFGYAALNANNNIFNRFLKSQKVDYYFYLSQGGTLKFRSFFKI